MRKVFLRRLFATSGALLIVAVAVVVLPPLLKIPSCEKQVDSGYRLAAFPAGWLARQLMVAFNAPGMTVAVGMDGQIVWTEGFGYADLTKQVSACPQTLFRIGSLSKPLTALAAAKLYEQGKLDLDASVQDYVPTFPDKGATITPRQLAGHIAGLRHYETMGEILNQRHFASLRDGLLLFENDPLLFPPGTHFSYSSYGYNLLGAVIEGASGEDYLVYMKDEVFIPLGMQNTLPDDGETNFPMRATFYEDLPNGLQVAPPIDNSYKYPSGGFLSTSEDLVHFTIGLTDEHFLKTETLEVLIAPICPECPAFGREREGDYAMGWQVEQNMLGRMVHHLGAAVGSSAALLMMPDQHASLVLMMNVGSVTNPSPSIHSLPPDPRWFIALFLLQRFLHSHPVLMFLIPIVMIAVVSYVYLRRASRKQS